MSVIIHFQAAITNADGFVEYAKLVLSTLIEYGGSIPIRRPQDNFGVPVISNKVEINGDV